MSSPPSQKRKPAQQTYSKRRLRRRVLDNPLTDPDDDDAWRSMSFHQPLLPKRPTSQKAATMTVEPTQEQIDTVVNVVGTDPYTAARYLRVKQCDPQAALNAILEGEEITKLEQSISWDPALMTADRDGNTNLHPLGASAAPTRGNSPAPSLKDSAPGTAERADADLARALAESERQDPPYEPPYGGWKQQESGTMNKDGTELKKVGPETRKEYDQHQWGMVVHGASELVPDVAIEDRVQGEGDGAPRFLKHLPDGDYTPSLITICHSIPVAREAFLLAGQTRSDYGYDADWWKGASIPKPRIITTADGSAADSETDRYDEFVAELQRLTAFLDSSNRVYASTGGLTQTDVMQNGPLTARSTSLLDLFMDTYTEVVGSRVGPEQAEQIAGLFTTRAGTIGQSGQSEDKTSVLEIKINCADDVADDLKPDLSEYLDKLVWDTDSTEPVENYVERPAEILVMKLRQENKSATHLNVRIPANLVMDKYLKENVPATRALREQIVQSKRRIKKITDIEERLQFWKRDNRPPLLDTRQLLKHTHGHFSGQNRWDADQADKTNNVALAGERPPHYDDVARQLETVMASIDEKLKVLAEEKQKARRAISDLSKTTPQELAGQELQYRYTLRGVATKPHITYVLRPKSAEDHEIEATEHNETMEDAHNINTDEENTTPAGMQWWRIEYEVFGQTAKIRRTKAEDYDVLRAVELENDAALVVYANDESNDVDFSELPQPLEEFIRKDNEQLLADIDASKRNPPPPYQDLGAPAASAGTLDGDVQWGGVPLALDEVNERDDDQDSTRAQHDGADYVADPDVVSIVGSHKPASLTMNEWLSSSDAYDSYPSAVNGSVRLDFDSTDPEPVDINLDDVADDSVGNNAEMEMQEKKGMPSLIPTQQRHDVTTEITSDQNMSGMGASQDLGVGGAVAHSEDSTTKGG